MSQANSSTIRLGARGSLLSRMQTQGVADLLSQQHPGLKVEVIHIKTTGDRIQDRPLHEWGGKGLFTKEIELALLEREIDVAVHSFKDVPVTMPLVTQENLLIAAVPLREDPRDVLVSRQGVALTALAPGAKLGTGSLRRQSQALALRRDLDVRPIRGNVDTRLQKLRAGEYDAVILALAGVKRSHLFVASEMRPLDFSEMLPAAGQGALAIECRKEDAPTRKLLEVLNDPTSARCVQIEREVVRRLRGDCHSPIAALAEFNGTELRLRVAVGGRDGQPPVIKAEAQGDAQNAAPVLDEVMSQLYRQGVEKLLGVTPEGNQ